MVKLKECCCGCTLRTGTLILAWLFLINASITSLLCTKAVFYPPLFFGVEEFAARETYFLIESIVGIVFSILALVGIEKNLANYLNYFFYYLFYGILSGVLRLLVLIVYPTMFVYVTPFETTFKMSQISHTPGAIVTIVMVYACILSLYAYFALVVRSYRDMLRKTDIDREDCGIPISVAEKYNVT